MCEQECCTQEEYENAVNCGNCAETPCYPPECKLCFPPSAAPCYRPQQTSYEPGITTCDPCNPCVERCNSCQTLGPYPMPLEDNPYQPRLPCPPLETCSPVCSPYRRYIQPKRRESCKPIVHYQRPMVPMPDDTVYRQSFDYIDAQTMASCRQRPVLPIGQLAKSCGEISDETVTRLSFQPKCVTERTRPYVPSPRSLLGEGPMQGLTTQMHDFVPKFQYQLEKIAPRDNIHRSCGCIEKETIQRLSFMPPDLCKFSRTESCKPIVNYKSPDLPMEFETTQKLSYMPICPPPKEDYPWARKANYVRPIVPFAQDTIAKLSYPPPGCFLSENPCCCEMKCDNTPRASC